MDRSSISSDESATLTYYFWGPGAASETAMACNILTYNYAKNETHAGNTLTSGSFRGVRVISGRDYPSGAKISVECVNPAGKVSRTLNLTVTGGSSSVSNINQSIPMSFTINGKNISNGESLALSDSRATVSWGSTNATSCTFNGENIGTSGSRTLSGLTSSSHKYVCTNNVGQSTALSFSIVVPGTSPETCNDMVVLSGAMCAPPAPTLSFSFNNVNVTNGTALTLPSPTATVSWGSKNAASCTFNGENVGTSGTKILSGITASSHMYVCTNSVGQSSTLSFSVVVSGGTVTNSSGLSAPLINQFSLDKTALPSNESATLTYSFWAPGVASEIPMACNILTYNIAKNETQAGNTLTYGSFSGTRTYAAKDYPTGAKISVECANPAGKVSRSVEFKIIGPTLPPEKDLIPEDLRMFVNGTNASSVTVREGDTLMLSWSAKNMGSNPKYYTYINYVHKGTYTVTSSSATTNSLGLGVGTHSIYLAACNGFTCSQKDSAPVTIIVNSSTAAQPAITWINATKACSEFVGVSSALITSGPNPIPSNYTVGSISYQYDSSNLNNLRNINTSGCSAPVYVPPAITWINATKACSEFVGVSSALITSGPNPIPSNYTVGSISYQYDSSNLNNLRNINTSGCSAPVSVAPANAVTISFVPNPVIRNVTPLTISYSTNFVTSDCSVWLDGAYLTSIAGSSYSWAVGKQDRARTVMITCALPGGGAVSSGPQTFTITDVTTSTGGANSVLATLGTSFQDAFNSVNTNILEQGMGVLSRLSGAATVSADTTPSKSCVNIASNLHRGNETPSVSKLQTFLVSKGLLSEKASGFFGDLTIEAVKAYQRSVGLKQTGMVYSATREAIMTETCN